MDNKELEKYLRDNLRKAYNFGQTYWQQADSEYRSQNKKANETAAKFSELVENVVKAVEFEMKRASGEAPRDQHNVHRPLLIARIKRYRAEFKCNLAEAKEACEYGRDLNADKTEFLTSPAPAIVQITDEQIDSLKDAIGKTEYKYFGDYEMSEGQRDAVDVLVETAKMMLSSCTTKEVAITDEQIIDICAKELPLMYHETTDDWLVKFARLILSASGVK